MFHPPLPFQQVQPRDANVVINVYYSSGFNNFIGNRIASREWQTLQQDLVREIAYKVVVFFLKVRLHAFNDFLWGGKEEQRNITN